MIRCSSVIWWRDAAKTSSPVKGKSSVSEWLQFFRNPTKILYHYIFTQTPKQAVCFSCFVFSPVYGSTFICHVFARCDISKTRCLSINTRACLYALKKCKFIVALYFCSFKVLGLFQRYQILFLKNPIFSYLYCIR